MKGILFSLGILIPTILPSQIRLVPFPGIFSTYIGAHLSKKQFCLRPLFRGLFFNLDLTFIGLFSRSFRPLSWGLSFNVGIGSAIVGRGNEFSSPFLGTFFQLPLI